MLMQNIKNVAYGRRKHLVALTSAALCHYRLYSTQGARLTKSSEGFYISCFFHFFGCDSIVWKQLIFHRQNFVLWVSSLILRGVTHLSTDILFLFLDFIIELLLLYDQNKWNWSCLCCCGSNSNLFSLFSWFRSCWIHIQMPLKALSWNKCLHKQSILTGRCSGMKPYSQCSSHSCYL